jgi:hypothetical protein
MTPFLLLFTDRERLMKWELQEAQYDREEAGGLKLEE